jgi:hypothetical protein
LFREFPGSAAGPPARRILRLWLMNYEVMVKGVLSAVKNHGMRGVW